MRNDSKNSISDKKEDLRNVIFRNKSGASMILFRNIDYVKASQRVSTLKRIYSDWRGNFIITRPWQR